jgi:hypothetical protein
MKGHIPICCILLITGLCSPVHAQENLAVSEPGLSLEDGKVRIDYRLINALPEGKYTIRIEVETQGGGSIRAKSLSGDIGEGIRGGGPKTIYWDFATDQVLLNEEIFVEVYAQPEFTIQAAPAEEQPEVQREEQAEDQAMAPKAASKEWNRTSLIVQSLPLPGLGLSRYTGNPHWIRGVAAYGCLGASVALNRQSWKTYQDYQEPSSVEEAETLFQQASDQKRLSRTLGYTALGIWLVDVGWTLIGTSGLGKKEGAHARGLKLRPSLEPHSGWPMLALSYHF